MNEKETGIYEDKTKKSIVVMIIIIFFLSWCGIFATKNYK